MVAHFASVAAALLLAFWSTVVTQYHDLRGLPPPTRSDEAPVAVVEPPAASTSAPTLFEGIAQNLFTPGATSAPTSTSTPKPVPRGPITPTTPTVPFTPLPVPTTPPITPTLPTPVTPPTLPVTPTTPAPDPKLADEALLRAAIVNVICLPGGGIRGSSGSGVIIDSRGIIMTVAHVAQNFLLRDYPTENAGTCYIRTGSPAKNAYSAELIYISPEWIEENEATFLTSRPTGTGENDFAFLAITGSITSAPLPSSFPAIPMAPADTDIDEGDEVGTGSYAAEFLSSSEVRSSLYPTIKFAEVDEVYTFGRNTIDIFSVAAGSAAQEGSSGGAVMNEDDRLIGIISTRTVKPDLALRTLQALTMDHVRRSFRADTGESLDTYLRGSLSSLVANFEDDTAELLEEVRDAIDDARD